MCCISLQNFVSAKEPRLLMEWLIHNIAKKKFMYLYMQNIILLVNQLACISSHFLVHWDQLLIKRIPQALTQSFTLIKLFLCYPFSFPNTNDATLTLFANILFHIHKYVFLSIPPSGRNIVVIWTISLS
jgi:hypothetical protein